MYRVLVADDERVIREGISEMIDWSSLGLELVGTAEDGRIACEQINKLHPNIVITDIRMPEMDGLELINTIHKTRPELIFIVLSGYGEFDYANQAMKYGVKRYILKPCDESEIEEALKAAIEELDHREKAAQLVQQMQNNWDKVLPQVKEQFLKDSISTGKYNIADYERFGRILQISRSKFQLILLRPETDCTLLERFALKNISEELIGADRVQIGTIHEGDVLLLILALDLQKLEGMFNQLKEVYRSYYHKNISIAVSDEGDLEQLPQLYRDVMECMNYAFYLGEGMVITKGDVYFEGKESTDLWQKEFEKISISIKTGNRDAASELIASFFDWIITHRVQIELTKNYCMELFLHIIRQSGLEELGLYASGAEQVARMETLQQIQQYITTIALNIAEKNYAKNLKRYSTVVDSMIQCVNEQLGNPAISLKWIAKEVLFMNEDYLGRLFQRETNERFSQYLLRKRMDKAKSLLEERDKYKIFEISELVGFGDNNHYFSQVFKKYTGFNPSEYKSMFEMKR